MNTPDSDIRVCEQCGAPLGHHRQDGLCTRCIARFSLLGPEDEDQRTGRRQTAVSAGPLPESTLLDSASGSLHPPSKTRFGDYELIEEIAHGGMGVVYRARQISLKRLVAVKMLLFGQFAGKTAFDRFRAEAETTARLQHPNIVAIHEIGETDGQPYFSMDYVAGRNLAELVRDRPLPALQAAGYVRKIAQAVQYAHTQGVLHRDLKPANVLIDDFDEPRITDFGLARRLVGDSELTLTGQVIGSPNFMPPEQGAGKRARVAPASDVYGLGALLYYLLTGRPPFVAETFETTLSQVLNTEPVAPRQLNPSIPRDLETLCLKCLEKDPARRYASAQELADELARFLAGEPILARAIGPAGKAWRWCQRNPRLASVVGVSALAVMVISGIAAWRISAARNRERLETYASSIALADRYIKDGSIDRALDLLYTNCPAEFRHWEWGHLLYLCHQDIVSIPAYTNLLRWGVGDDRPIRSLAFDATGTRLGVLCGDGQVKVFSPNDGRQLFASTNTDNRVMSWAFHPAGSEFALGMTNGTILIFDTTTWHQKQILWLEGALTNRLGLSNNASALQGEKKGQPSMVSITSAAYDPTGHRLAGATSDGRVKVWNLVSGQERLIPADEPVAIEKVWFTPDGHQLVTKRQLAVRRLDGETGREVSTFREEPDKYWAIFADPTGQHLASIDIRDGVQLWSNGIPTHALGAMTLAHPGERNLFFSPDGQFLCTAGDQSTARLYRVATGRELFAIEGRVRCVAFDRQGTRLVATGSERLAKVLDITQGEELLPLRGHLSVVDEAAFSPDGRFITLASRDGYVRIWSSSPGRDRYDVGLWTWADAYSPDGKRLTVTGWMDNLKVWDAESGRLDLVLKSRTHFPQAAAFSPDGRYIVSVGSEKVARIWDAHSGDLVRVLRGHTRSILTVAYSRDGQRIATGDVGGIVMVWEAQTGRLVQTLRDNCGPLWSVEFDRSGQLLLAADYDGPPRIWEVESGRLRWKLKEGFTGAYSARFSPDGRWVAALSKDQWLRIWDAGTGRLVDKRKSRSKGTLALSYSPPDGHRLAVPVSDTETPGLDKGMIEIWDIEHGRQLLELKNHTECVSTARFSPPDGRRLLTTAADFAARQEESFPWWETDYAGQPGATFRERVRAYAREYWHARLAAENATPLKPPPGSSPKDPDHDIFPARDPRSGSNQIDLSAHYTGSLDAIFYATGDNYSLDDDLEQLRPGLVTLGDVLFDVRGVVMLRRLDPGFGSFQKMWDRFPKVVSGIVTARRVRRLQVLQGVYCLPMVKDGTPIGSFVWHYADGSQHETEIIYGRDVRNWWFGEVRDTAAGGSETGDPQWESERGRVVWTGDNPVGKKAGAKLRLYLTPYYNPQPDLEVTSIDFVSKMTTAAPFLVALTVEP